MAEMKAACSASLLTTRERFDGDQVFKRSGRTNAAVFFAAVATFAPSMMAVVRVFGICVFLLLGLSRFHSQPRSVLADLDLACRCVTLGCVIRPSLDPSDTCNLNRF